VSGETKLAFYGHLRMFGMDWIGEDGHGQMEYKIMSFLIEYSTGAMKTLTPEIDGGNGILIIMHIFYYV
jgi:hypothetical protein